MECKTEHFRHILLFYSRKGKNAAQAAKKLRDVYGEEALKERQCRNWFDKFRSGDFSQKDDQRSGRPEKLDDDQIKAMIESDSHVNVREIAVNLNGKTFNDDDAVKSHLVMFFADKDQTMYKWGIMMLPERWQKVIDQNGKYIIE
ncbi:hypothetical protein ACJJTC_004304 [Scirpophaga incertulas]